MAARLTGADPLARLAVVMPVAPGDGVSPELVQQLGGLPPGAQVHVVCTGDDDASRLRKRIRSHADGPSWAVHTARAGRATQQNAGAYAAARPWLWFLHADSRLASGTLPALAGLVAANRPAIGYFDLRFLDDGPGLMALNALGARLRSRWLGLPFGDQGLAMPKVLFDALGGFDEALRCGEDHDLVWRARRAGYPLQALRAPLYTSARKYVQHGWLRTTSWTVAETWRQARRFSGRAAK